MGMGQAFLNGYKNDVANADIGITVLKREEKVMTKSEQIAAMVAELTEEESRQLGAMLLKRAENMHADEVEKARLKFVKAYSEFRQLAPTESLYVEINDEDGEYCSDIDLYEYLDSHL